MTVRFSLGDTLVGSLEFFLKEISPECSLEGYDAEAETRVLWPPHAKS